MVEMIGLVTMCALVWLLTATLAGESDAERRRSDASPNRSLTGDPSGETRQAA